MTDKTPEAACNSCGANWSQGKHTEGCKECGGGAMTITCFHCDGLCGNEWTRRIVDSWDEAEAQWLGGCGAKCTSCGAAWGLLKHTEGCEECGGGSMIAICPDCHGACKVIRERDVGATWQARAARWRNRCGRQT